MIVSLLAGAAGYVLGARAGRERYEKIMGLVRRMSAAQPGDDPSGRQGPAMITRSRARGSAAARESR